MGNVLFPTTKDYTLDEVKAAQKELLSMAKVIAKILEDNNIGYCMAFGTLIGAKKFNGFLPWDDDIDFFIFDDKYKKAIELLETKLPMHLIIHGEKNDPNYFLNWNVVRNVNIPIEIAEIYHPHNKLLGQKYLGVGLYRLKRISAAKVACYKKNEAISFFKRKLDKGIISALEYNNEIIKVERNYLDEGCTLHNVEEEIFTCVVKVNKHIPLDAILPLKKIDFEDTKFFAPNDPLAVLECSFDNLDELPPYEERKTHLKSIKFKN